MYPGNYTPEEEEAGEKAFAQIVERQKKQFFLDEVARVKNGMLSAYEEGSCQDLPNVLSRVKAVSEIAGFSYAEILYLGINEALTEAEENNEEFDSETFITMIGEDETTEQLLEDYIQEEPSSQ